MHSVHPIAGTPIELDDDAFVAQREEALAAAQSVLCGRYSIEIVAEVCATLLCQSVGSAGAEPQEAETLIDNFVDNAIDVMRRNWATLQQTHRLIVEPTGGHA